MSAVTGPYLRTTVLSGRQRLDVVLPAERPVAEVLPAVLDLLQTPDPETVSVLHTDTGQAISLDRSLAQAGLRDGVILHLAAVREAPAEPVVADLIDVFETAYSSALRFGANAQQWLLSASGAALLVIGFLVLARSVGSWAPFLLAGSTAGAWLMALIAASARWRPAWPSLAVTASLLSAGSLLTAQTAPPLRGLLAFVAVIVGILTVGACADRRRPALMTCAVVTGIGSATGLTWLITTDVFATGAVGMFTSVLTCGLLPQWALALSGAFTIDGRVQSGELLGQSLAQHCLLEASRTLTAALAATCVLFAASGSALALAVPGNTWAGAVFLALLLIFICRIRHFPLTVQRASILSAALVCLMSWGVAMSGAAASGRPWVGIAVVVLGAGLLGGNRVHPSALLGAVGRRWIRRVELVAVLATMPLLVGFFGVYGDLFTTF